MIKSIKRRNNIDKRIAAAKARADARLDNSFDLRAALDKVGIEAKKQYPWEREFHHQDASGTSVHGRDGRDWEFINPEYAEVKLSKIKKMRKPLTAGV